MENEAIKTNMSAFQAVKKKKLWLEKLNLSINILGKKKKMLFKVHLW